MYQKGRLYGGNCCFYAPFLPFDLILPSRVYLIIIVQLSSLYGSLACWSPDIVLTCQRCSRPLVVPLLCRDWTVFALWCRWHSRPVWSGGLQPEVSAGHRGGNESDPVICSCGFWRVTGWPQFGWRRTFQHHEGGQRCYLQETDKVRLRSFGVFIDW